MSADPRVLVFAGSTRSESYNKKLARLAVQAIHASGGQATFLDLRDLALPLFDEDFEARDGLPPGAVRLKEQMLAHDALLIASPEYNSSITGVLKNAIDWASRKAAPSEAALACFAGKVAAIMSASPGALGGLRGLVHLRAILGNIQVLVIPDQLAIVKANDAFQHDGTLKDANQQASVERICRRLVETARKLRG